MADEWRCEVNKEGNSLPSEWGGMFEGRIEEDKLCFYMSIEDCEDINKSTVKVKLEDIYMYHDKGVAEDGVSPEEELVYDGSWEFSWTYDYKATERRVAIKEFVDIAGYKYYVRDVQITPFEVNVRAWTLNDRKTDSGLSVDEIRLADGSVIETFDGGGGGRGSTVLPIIDHVEGYAGVAWLGYVLNPSEVVSIVVNGIEINL